MQKMVTILFFFTLFFASLFVLSSCSIVEVTTKNTLNSPKATITTTNSLQQLVGDTLNSSNTEDYYKVNVPTSLNGNLIYFTVEGQNLELTLYDANKTAVRESDSPNFFGAIGSGLSGSSLNNQAIVVEPKSSCRGPCILIEKASGTVYLRVKVKSGSTNYKLYSFTGNHRDDSDPQNNPTIKNGQIFCDNIKVSAIVTVPTNKAHTGAIETVEDVDCFRTKEKVNKVTLQTFSTTTITATAYVYLNTKLLGKIIAPPRGAATQNLTTNAIVTVPTNNIVTVIVVGGDPNKNEKRAAVADKSKYKLTFE